MLYLVLHSIQEPEKRQKTPVLQMINVMVPWGQYCTDTYVRWRNARGNPKPIMSMCSSNIKNHLRNLENRNNKLRRVHDSVWPADEPPTITMVDTPIRIGPCHQGSHVSRKLCVVVPPVQITNGHFSSQLTIPGRFDFLSDSDEDCHRQQPVA